MRLLMENIKPVGEPGATGSIFIFIFRKGWPEFQKQNCFGDLSFFSLLLPCLVLYLYSRLPIGTAFAKPVA